MASSRQTAHDEEEGGGGGGSGGGASGSGGGGSGSGAGRGRFAGQNAGRVRGGGRRFDFGSLGMKVHSSSSSRRHLGGSASWDGGASCLVCDTPSAGGGGGRFDAPISRSICSSVVSCAVKHDEYRNSAFCAQRQVCADRDAASCASSRRRRPQESQRRHSQPVSMVASCAGRSASRAQRVLRLWKVSHFRGAPQASAAFAPPKLLPSSVR